MDPSEFGLASGPQPDGKYQRVWFGEVVPGDGVAFEAGVFLLTKTKAQELEAKPTGQVVTPSGGGFDPIPDSKSGPGMPSAPVPPEVSPPASLPV